MQYVLGVDGGGTKTLAAVADTEGNVLGICRTGASNFQGIGTVRAGINLKEAIEGAIQDAGIEAEKPAFATYGIAGADRDDDFDIVHSYVEPVNPAPCYMITNDTTIALRAGTRAGVGVALIAGTGSNTIGFSPDYVQKKVGGLGRLTGDYGSAIDLAEKGVVASMKYYDGRGPKTVMYNMFCLELGLEKLEDIIEFFYIDKYVPVNIHLYAPVVFKAANAGDKVALRILKQTGKEVGREAVTCLKALFGRNEKVTVVLGGSVFQRGENPVLVNTLKEYIQKRFPMAEVLKLRHEPCLGALLWSLDCLRSKPVQKTFARKISGSLAAMLKHFEEKADP